VEQRDEVARFVAAQRCAMQHFHQQPVLPFIQGDRDFHGYGYFWLSKAARRAQPQACPVNRR